MTLYLGYGIGRHGSSFSGWAFVDARDFEDAHTKLQQIFGRDTKRKPLGFGGLYSVSGGYTLVSIHIQTGKTVPKTAKNVVFTSYEELCAAAPDFNSRRRKRQLAPSDEAA